MSNNEKRKQNRIAIVDKIVDFAQDYKENLLGNTFMFVFDNRFIEISFTIKEFAHLTGVDKKLTAKEFYNDALNKRLRENQIWFSERYPYELCVKKTKNLKFLYPSLNSALFILETIKTDTYTYKFGFTELEFTLLLGEDIDKNGNKRSKYFFPKSFRIEDCFKKSENVYAVDYIFKKKNDKKIYDSILYNSDVQIPTELKDKISEDIYTTLNI
ncbi:MAG: PBECR4 domain-containing protein [Clostridia bacterium]